MDILAQFLDARAQSCDWRPVDLPPEERLVKFDAWLFRQLSARLDWTWAGNAVAQGRRINQARLHVEQLVFALWRRGWLLDGSALAAQIVKPLEIISKYQKAGRIENFWPYFCATMRRFVGANSEEIQLQAKAIGATMGQILGDLKSVLAQNHRSLPELLAARAEEVADAKAGSLREKQRRYRAKESISAEKDAQMPLL